MKFLIIDTYYRSFLNNVRIKNPSLSKKDYGSQLKFLLSQCFGTSDYYSSNLRKLGHTAYDIIANDEILQRRWAKENAVSLGSNNFLNKIRTLPLVYKILGRPDWVQEVALAQIKKYHPDVLYMQDLTILNPDTLRAAKKYCRLVVGQIASPLPPTRYLNNFDLILTSFPHFVRRIKAMGIKSEYFKIGFEKLVLRKLGRQPKKFDVTFVGGFTPQHAKGTKVLEEAAKKIRIDVWGRGVEFLSPASPLKKHYHGEAWGLEMYKILAESKITLNRHISVAEDYANNMRLYEATGMGAMLLTDSKRNLGELFTPGKEVIEYKNSHELVEKIKHFLVHTQEREKVAAEGQRRTLKAHTYEKRMMELINIVGRYIKTSP